MYKNKMRVKSDKELAVDRKVERILAPSQKRSEALQNAGRFMTVEVDYHNYQVLRELAASGDSMILNVKQRGKKGAPGKPFIGQVILMIG